MTQIDGLRTGTDALRTRRTGAGTAWRAGCLVLALSAAACAPVARIPALGAPLALGRLPTPGLTIASADGPHAALVIRARALAPLLLHHRREPFALERVVAVVHPTRPVIAYHLLWRDDAHGAWLPGTVPTDEEVVWVGHDASGAPTDLWTYWHGAILHTPWRGRQVVVTVQWGKHGSLPLGVREDQLPRGRTVNAFYAYHWIGLPDLWLSRLARRGPLGFFAGYRDYRRLDVPLLLGDRIDAVVVAREPDQILAAVFGRPYSEKPDWPWRPELTEVKDAT